MRARKNKDYIASQDSLRFWSYADKSGECWLWTGMLKPNGYGRFATSYQGRMQYHNAHRWAYQSLVGPIPDGLTLDHLCRVRNCVKPDHLEPVTNRVNIMRGNSIPARRGRQTHCLNGHELSGWNAMISKLGHRSCRACHYKRAAEKRAEVRASA